MLSELLTWILKTYLGKYLDDFNPAQLSVALLSGEVELENVPIKKDALRSFGLPLQARMGSIRKIKLKVPVRKFNSARLCIEIEEIYAVFERKVLDTLDLEMEKTSLHELKLELLDAFEAKLRSEKGFLSENYYSTSYLSWLNYGTTMAIDVLENLELKISDLHLIYEDPFLKYCGGIKFSSMSAHTCNSNWIPGSYQNVKEETNFKLIELKNCCFYWNKNDAERKILHDANDEHRYIVHPFSARSQCKREKCKELKDRSRMVSDIIITEATVSMSDVQITKIMECISTCRELNSVIAYRLKRPSCKISQNAILWWKYAAKCHGVEFIDSRKKWIIVKENIRYIKLYKRVLINPNEAFSREEREFKLYFEKSNELETLKTLRSISWSNAIQCDVIPKVEFLSRNNHAKKRLFHWFPNWRGWYKNVDQTSQNAEIQGIEEDILSAIEDSIDSETSVYEVKENVLGCFTFSLMDGKAIINTESETVTQAFEIHFHRILTLFEVNPEAKKYLLGVSIGSVSIKDMFTAETAFPYLIKSSNLGKVSQKLQPVFTKNFINREDENDPWFQLQCNSYASKFCTVMDLDMKSLNLEVYFNTNAFKGLTQLFSEQDLYSMPWPKSGNLSCHIPNDEQTSELRWYFNVDASLPQVIFVKDFKERRSDFITIEFGRLHLRKVKSNKTNESKTSKSYDVINENDQYMTPCSTPPGSKASSPESPDMLPDSCKHLPLSIRDDFESVFCESIYDKYILQINDIQMTVLCNEAQQPSTTSSSSYLLEKFNISLKVEHRKIDTKDPKFPFIVVHANIEKLVACICEEKLETCLVILYPIILMYPTWFTHSSEISTSHQDNLFLFDPTGDNNDIAISIDIGCINIGLRSHLRCIIELQIIGTHTHLQNTIDGIRIQLSLHGLLVLNAIHSFGSNLELLVASQHFKWAQNLSEKLKESNKTSSQHKKLFDSHTTGDKSYLNEASTLFCKDYLQFESVSQEQKPFITADIELHKAVFAPNQMSLTIAVNNLDLETNQEILQEHLKLFMRISEIFGKLYRYQGSATSKGTVDKNISILASETKWNFNFSKLNILLTRTIVQENQKTSRKLAALFFADANIQGLICEHMWVSASLGSLHVIDLSKEEVKHTRLFSIGKNPTMYLFGQCYQEENALGENIINVEDLNTSNALTVKVKGDRNSFTELKIHMESLYYTHCSKFIYEITVCFSDLIPYISWFASSWSSKAEDKDVGHCQLSKLNSEKVGRFRISSSKTSLGVIINSPVIILPQGRENCKFLVVNLGKITAHKASSLKENCVYLPIDGELQCVTLWTRQNFFLDVRNASIYSTNAKKTKKERRIVIMHNTALNLKFTRDKNRTKCAQNFTINNTIFLKGGITKMLQVSLRSEQCIELRNTIENIINMKIDAEHSSWSLDSLKNEDMESENCMENNQNFNELFVEIFVPAVHIALKNESSSAFDLLFFDLQITHHDDKEKKNIEIQLKSIKMEEPSSSKQHAFRSIVDSSPRRLRQESLTQCHFASSCPDLSQWQKQTEAPCTSTSSRINLRKRIHKNIGNHTDFCGCGEKNIVSYFSDNDMLCKKIFAYKYCLWKTKRKVNKIVDINFLSITVTLEQFLKIIEFLKFSANTKSTETVSLGNATKKGQIFEMECEISFQALTFVAVQKDEEILQLTINRSFFRLSNGNDIKHIEGHVGSLLLNDLTSSGGLYREKFVTIGKEALCFRFDSYDDHMGNYNLSGWKGVLRMQVSPLRYIHTKKFFVEFYKFFAEILRFKSIVSQDIKNESNHTPRTSSKVQLQIFISSPVIVLPLCSQSRELLIVDLGELSINSFSCPSLINTSSLNGTTEIIEMFIFNADIFAANRVENSRCEINTRKRNNLVFKHFVFQKVGKSLLSAPIVFQLRFEQIISSNTNEVYPQPSLKGTCSKISVVLTAEHLQRIKGIFASNIGEGFNSNSTFRPYNSYTDLTPEKCTNFSNSYFDAISKELFMQVDLDNVSVLILPSFSNARNLIKINVVTSFFTFDSFTDKSQNIHLLSKQISVTYSRDKTTALKYLLQATKDETENAVQADVQIRKRPYHVKFTVVFNNVRIIYIVDCLKTLKFFFNQKPSYNNFDNIISLRNKLRKNPPENINRSDGLRQNCVIIVNIANSELVLAENIRRRDSTAIILKTTLILSYKKEQSSNPISMDVDHLEVFSCISDIENETALSIIDPCALSLEVRENSIYLSMQNALNIRFSYKDLKTFTKLFNTINESHDFFSKSSENTDSEFDTISPLIAMGFPQRQSVSAMKIKNYEMNDAALWLTQQRPLDEVAISSSICKSKVVVNTKYIFIWIIDDCMDSDVPLVEISLRNFIAKQDICLSKSTPLSDLYGSIESLVCIDYYNRHLSGYEPFIESCDCKVRWSYSKPISEYAHYSFTFSSTELFKVNITTTLLELFRIVAKNWMCDFFSAPENQYLNTQNENNVKYRVPFQPFALHNLTGETLLFARLASSPGGMTRTNINTTDLVMNWRPVEPNELIEFDFGPQTKLRHFDSRQLNLHQILVQIHGWTIIGPISIDKVGTFFKYSTYELHKKQKMRIIFDISLVGSAKKLVTVRSALRIFNGLSVKMKLKLESKFQNLKLLQTLSPNESLSVPLRFTDSILYLKPSFDKCSQIEEVYKQITFCKCKVPWWQCTDTAINEIHQCVADETSFFFIVETKKESFSPRDSDFLPGHKISFSPPLKIYNLLCINFILKICDTNHSFEIKASKSIDIHAFNTYDSFSLSIELENFKSATQLKIPTNHSGLVEPKFKLIDALNRELYLRVSIQSYSGKGLEIYFRAPIVIINRTGLPLIFRQEGSTNEAAGQFDENETALVVSPLMFSFSNEDALPSLEFRMGAKCGSNKTWCQSFCLRERVLYREIKPDESNQCYTFGIYICRGHGLLLNTTFVKLTSKYILRNESSSLLHFAQSHNHIDPAVNIMSVPSGCNYNFYWQHYEQEPLLCMRVVARDESRWSKGFPVSDVQSLYINVRGTNGDMHFFRLEILLRGATFILIFTDARMLPPPIRIDNYSNVFISFWQSRCQPFWKTTVKAQSSLAYVLDDPLGTMSLQIEAPGGNLIEYNLENFDAKSLTYANFIYIAFGGASFSHNESESLVLAVRNGKVIIASKNAADRSQLWLMNAFGQLEHEGTSPPCGYLKTSNPNPVKMVLDIEKSPDPINNSRLVIRPPNKQRFSTQTWKFENGHLTCHANMCIQVTELKPNAAVFLGRIKQNTKQTLKIYDKQYIEIQKLRPGSGKLEIKTKMDGPIHAVEIFDVIKTENSVSLSKDPKSDFVSISNSVYSNDEQKSAHAEFSVTVDLPKGLSVSLVTRQPFEELLYLTLDNVNANVLLAANTWSIALRVKYLQIDNQFLESTCPVLFHTLCRSDEEKEENAILLIAKILGNANNNAVIFEELLFNLKPCVIFLEELLILKIAQLFGYGQDNTYEVHSDWESFIFGDQKIPKNPTRYYFDHLILGETQVRFSMYTTPKLSTELLLTKKMLGLTLIKFEDALIELDLFLDRYHFETKDVFIKSIKNHYINQIKLHAASILGSVDFLGNPLGLANDLSEGVSSLIFEGSVTSLVKSVTHGFSNSTAKLTEALSDSLGKMVLDDRDKETRQKILKVQSNTSTQHIAAGLKGLGFGVLGGVTSIVRHSYIGAQTDGLPGFLNGLGRGLVGTVTKPIIGVLDLASETACAVRQSSRNSGKHVLERKRLPRCVFGAPGGLLPPFSYRQSKGQQYLYLINRNQLYEKLMSYEPNLCYEKDTKLRLLVSTEFVRIFSRVGKDVNVTFACHLSEILSCHPLTTTIGSFASLGQTAPSFYIEISTNLPKITRPRIRCQNEEIAERAARYINYAKAVYEERELCLLEDL